MLIKDEKQPLHVKYRPKNWEEVLGNKQTLTTLQGVLKEGKIKTFLLYGPTGCGKTTIARLIADTIGCKDIDFQEINAANNRGIDTIREIVGDSRFQAFASEAKVFLLDEADQITGIAAEALLKVIEDTPPDTYFILATSKPEKLTATVKNRCSAFPVHILNNFEIRDLLVKVAGLEGITNVPTNIMQEIARKVDGCPRQALQILAQVCVLNDEQEMLSVIENYSGESKNAMDLCRVLLNKGWPEVLPVLEKVQDEDPEGVRRSVMGYMSKVILSDGDKSKRASKILTIFAEPIYNTGKPGIVLACWRCYL